MLSSAQRLGEARTSNLCLYKKLRNRHRSSCGGTQHNIGLRIISAQHKRADCILNHVRVRGQVRAVQVVQQLLPFLEGVAYRFAQENRWRNLESLRFEPLLEVLENRQNLVFAILDKRFRGKRLGT